MILATEGLGHPLLQDSAAACGWAFSSTGTVLTPGISLCVNILFWSSTPGGAYQSRRGQNGDFVCSIQTSYTAALNSAEIKDFHCVFVFENGANGQKLWSFEVSDFFVSSHVFWRVPWDTVSGPEETHFQDLHQRDLSINSFFHWFDRCFIIQMHDE